MLELKNISVSFRSENQEKWFRTTRTQVLSDISFQLKKIGRASCRDRVSINV